MPTPEAKGSASVTKRMEIGANSGPKELKEVSIYEGRERGAGSGGRQSTSELELAQEALNKGLSCSDGAVVPKQGRGWGPPCWELPSFHSRLVSRGRN